MEQQRLFLALALSLGLLFTYQELILRRQSGAPVPAAESESSGPSTVAGGGSETPKVVATASRGFSVAPSDELVVVSTDNLIATFTRRGARLVDLELKNFRREIAADSPPLDLVFPLPVLPLTLVLGDGAGDAGLDYTVDTKSVAVSGAETAEVKFQWRSPSGRRTLEKRYRFRGDSHRFEIAASGSGLKGKSPSGILLTPLRPDGHTGGTPTDKAMVLAKHKIAEHDTKALLAESEITPETQWVGFSNQYFLMALIAPAGVQASSALGITETWPTARLMLGGRDGVTASVFAGPKDREVLIAAGSELDRSLDFGWFWFVAVPLLRLLNLLYDLTRNYGVAIILLTALVRLVTIPLSQSSFKNMREMQKLQPQVERLRAKFKDDQMALQKETMELYRRHKVNPLSGCLPMLLQLPVFVGLYNGLYHAIELRHAPFMLWIDDLAAPDRLMVAGVGIPVLTIIMGASMLVQQWLTPTQGDPSQKTVMMIMPVVFTFMFINFPSGLVLYWLVSNILSIAQQYYVTRMAK
jgi:YidC/Oxa1 family membrane protein insertase